MKLYKIRDWDSIYENNRSRTVKELAWVAIPNKHDGENFSLIMAHPRGAEIFAAFVLMVEVASKCHPRGVLVRDNGVPHTVSSLSVKCRAPDVWFQIAFDYLEANTDWLVVEEKDVTDKRQETVSVLSASCQSGAYEGRERMEGKGGNGAALAHTPSWEEFWEYCKMHGMAAEFYARDKFLAAECDNWKGKSKWTAYADRCRTWWEGDGRPMAPKNQKPPNAGEYAIPEGNL